MKNYHETTDGLIVPFEKINFIKHQKEIHNIRIVFDNGFEENFDEEEIAIVENFKRWLTQRHRSVILMFRYHSSNVFGDDLEGVENLADFLVACEND